ncbi:MAG: sugar phosphate isomerase/epimerase family protein [Planctomycetota bacterium]
MTADRNSPPPMDRLAIHTQTTKPLSLSQAVTQYAHRNVPAISVWVEALEGLQVAQASRLISDHGLKVPALVRGGFFCAGTQAERDAAVDRNRDLIDTARVLDADMLVLVVGAIPGVALGTQRTWVADAITKLDEQARQAGVKIAIEPLHPMYAGDKSCINRMTEARIMCEQIGSPNVGVAVDVYHVWWDPELDVEIARLGQQDRLFAFHVCDWRVPTRDLLTDRALMGDGCIDIAAIRHAMTTAGFDGWIEVEIFSEDHWSGDQGEFLDSILDRFRTAS